MANTYNATPVFSALTAVGPNTETAQFNLANTVSDLGLGVNDIIKFISIPPGALVTRIVFDVCILFTSGSALLDIGTDLTVAQGGVDVAGFFSSSAQGTNFTAVPAIISETNDATYVHASLPFNFNQETQFSGILLKNATLQMRVHTAGTTPATTGVINCTCEWTMTQLSNLL